MKFGIVLIYAIFTQMMIIMMSYEFLFYYARSNGGIGYLNAIEAVNPFIWIMIALEVIITAIYFNVEWENKKHKKS